MKILLATPVGSETVTVVYMNSVIRLLAEFASTGITINRHLIAHTLISRSRNAFASIVLNDASYTHLLFIDSDMGFNPSAVRRMIEFDAPLCGCVYPSRRMDFETYHAIGRAIPDAGLARSAGLNYVGQGWEIPQEVDGRPALQLRNGFVKTSRIAGGFTLIQRTVLEQIAARYPELLAQPDGDYASSGVAGPVLQCFEPFQGADGLFLSEDISFSERWTAGCGGEIWACIDEPLTHYGTLAYTGRYIDRLSTGFGHRR